MKLFFLLLCVSYANSLYTSNCSLSKEKIYGGYNDRMQDIPYLAALEKAKKLFCGAVIIAKDWLLSAAHCFIGIDDPPNIVRVRVGSPDKDTGGKLFKIKDIKIHEAYNQVTYDADIVLIELKKPIPFNENQTSIPISNTTAYPDIGTKMKISGKGKILNLLNTTSDRIKSAIIKIITRAKCVRRYPILLPANRIFCATSYPHDSCHADSGGPGIIDGKLAAIVIGGHPQICGHKYFPGIYTNVGYFFTWIQHKTGLTFGEE